MQSDSSAPRVSIIVVTYNNEKDIVDCLNSILSQDYQNFEIVIVDNSSTDNTVMKIMELSGKYQGIRLIQSKENTGYAGGNNLGFQHSRGELVVLLNPDLVVDTGWLSHLVQAYDKSGSSAGIICSNVLLFDKRDTINACGNIIHLAGFAFSRFYMEKEAKCYECDDAIKKDSIRNEGEIIAIPVPAPSGASMMFSRATLNKIGRKEPFDTGRFFMEYSDIDLALDFLSHDLISYVAPKSRVFHKFRFKMDNNRLAILERGRYQILGHLTLGTRFSLLPALFLGEIIVWSFIIFGKSKNKGMMVQSKLGTYSWLLGNNVTRSKNSKVKDLKIIEAMSPNLIIYDEMTFEGNNKERNLQQQLNSAHSFSNKLFCKTRNSIMNSLQR